jgi:hypothetical protein
VNGLNELKENGMEQMKTALADDVKRLLDAITQGLSQEEAAKIDPSALAAVRAHFAGPSMRRSTWPSSKRA